MQRKVQGRTALWHSASERGDIKRLFLQAVARLTEEREVLLETCVMLRDEYLNTEAIDTECSALADEMEIVEALTKKLIAENATTAMP